MANPISPAVSARGRALVIDASGLATPMRDCPAAGPGEVVVRVEAVGLCRTDLYAIEGRIPVAHPRVPGHEFSGTVVSAGTDGQHLVGKRIVANPMLPCRECDDCRRGAEHNCVQTEFLGLDRDGACAGWICMPADCCRPIPDDLSAEEAAFAEPVAAVLAVTKAEIDPRDGGLLIGDNRIAELTHRVLRASGFERVERAAPEALGSLPADAFDFVVETQLTSAIWQHMVRLVRPRGNLILKSRQWEPVELTLRELLPKEPRLQPVHYGPFDEAVELLAARRVRVDDLVGERFALADYRQALRAAGQSETHKVFLLPGEA